jgi:hypothetical protein
MIKITTLVIAILFVLNTNAQIKKGKVLVGGQISAGSSKTSIVSQPFPSPLPAPFPSTQTISNKVATIGISVGKAIKENKVVGFNFTTFSLNEKQAITSFDTTSRKTNQYEVGVFYRQYKKLAKDLNFYVQLDAAAIFGKEKITYNSFYPYNLTVEQSGGRLFFSPGVSYAILKKLQLEISMPNLVSIAFLHSSQTSENPNIRTATNDQFSFNTSLSNNAGLGNLGVGFRLIL